MIGMTLLWLLSLVSALLLVAGVMALASKLTRFHIRFILPALSALLPLIAGLGATVFAYNWSAPKLPWLFGYTLSWTLIYLFGAAFILVRGASLRDQEISACRWPRGQLAAWFAAVLVPCLCTLLILDNTARIKIAVIQSDALSVALALQPPRVSDHRNASLIYDNAFESMEEGKWPDWWDESKEPAFDPSKDEIKEFLEGNKAAIALLERAASMPEYYQENNYLKGEVSDLMPYKNAAGLLSLNARFKAAKGDTKAAMENIAAIRGMAGHLKTIPLITANLMGATIQDIGTRTVENILPYGPLVPKGVVRRSSDHEAAHLQKAFHRAMRMDEALMAFITTSYLTVNPVFPWFPLGDRLYRAVLLHVELTSAREIMLEAHTIAEKPYRQAVDDWGRWENSVKAFKGLITAVSITSYGRVMGIKVLEAEAGIRLTILALAASAYRADHGIYPASTELLTPHYIATIPADPFSGERLRLASMEGGLILYSVGPDLKDDGGAREYDTELYDNGIKTGDIMFVMGSAFEDRRLKPSREYLQKRVKERGSRARK